jgi:hypothetical protein
LTVHSCRQGWESIQRDEDQQQSIQQQSIQQQFIQQSSIHQQSIQRHGQLPSVVVNAGEQRPVVWQIP